MTDAQAIRRAMSALLDENKRIAFDANLCDRLGATHAEAVNASTRRKQNVDALAVLSRMLSDCQVKKRMAG